jgi:hypothetical protein
MGGPPGMSQPSLPQVAEKETPQPQDAAGEFLM